MDEMFDNKLDVKLENGNILSIRVLDIIDSEKFNKSFILYTLEGDNENVFSSILEEKDDSYTLKTIESKEEMDFINSEIDREVEEED